jgi:hypothetical protein
MIKSFGTALILASTLAFGITDAQAHAAPKAYAALIGVTHRATNHSVSQRAHRTTSTQTIAALVAHASRW